jgi:hypothetical protein
MLISDIQDHISKYLKNKKKYEKRKKHAATINSIWFGLIEERLQLLFMKNTDNKIRHIMKRDKYWSR